MMLPLKFPALNCVDVSRWGGEVTAAEADWMIDHGVTTLIAATGHPNGAGWWARQQLGMWIARNEARGRRRGDDYEVEAYIYLYFAYDGPAQVNQGVNTLAGIPVDRWWLDAEDVDASQAGLSVAQRTAFLTACVARSAELGLNYGVYSSAWWWRPYMANSTAFANLPLWDSLYPAGASINNVVIVPWGNRAYGGWAEPAIHQYEGTTYVGDDTVGYQSVDLNWKPYGALEGTVAYISRAEFEDSVLAMFAGAEDKDDKGNLNGRDVRLANAMWRLAETAAGRQRSISDVARSAEGSAAGTLLGKTLAAKIISVT